MVRPTTRERNVAVARLHDDRHVVACRSITLAALRRGDALIMRRTFRSIHYRLRAVMLTLMIGAKQTSTPRKPRRTLPSAERRLRSSFPEVWAWYELLVAARGAPGVDALATTRQQEMRTRTLAR
jgi:hypothetical protein